LFYYKSSFAIRSKNLFNKITDITQDESLSRSTSNIEQLDLNLQTFLLQIFKTIEQAYLVKIDFPQTKLNNCYLTTSLSDQPLPEKIKIICKALVTIRVMK
jgi:hypothetical protein